MNFLKLLKTCLKKSNFGKMFYLKKIVVGISVSFILFLGFSINGYGKEFTSGYYLNINSKGALYSVYINGIKVESRTSVKTKSSSIPISYALKKGINDIEIKYSPLVGKDENSDDYIIGVKEKFYINSGVERVDYTTREKEFTTIINASYDMDKGEIKEGDHFNGIEVAKNSEHLKVENELHYKSESLFYNAFTKPIAAYSISKKFELSDWFPEFVWVNAQEIEMSDSLKDEIRNVYSSFHETINNNNYEKFLNYMGPLWTQVGTALGLDGLDGYLNSISLNKNNIRVHSPGVELAELKLPESNEDLHVEIAGKGKLATVLPSPIKWVRSDGSGPVMKVAFYKDQSGEWRVGAVF